MLNTILKSEKKEQHNISVESLLNEVYLLPKWEKIKEVVLMSKRFFLPSKSVHANLFRKFSSKNSIEKYSLKDRSGNTIGSVDLRVYKDSVYIINMNVESNFEAAVDILIQAAAEKALYNTTERQLKINLSFSAALNNRLKKVLLCEDFILEEAQSKYEVEMFGQTFTLNVQDSHFWQKRIKQMPILINK